MLPWASFSRKTAIPKITRNNEEKEKKKRGTKDKNNKKKEGRTISIYISYLLKST
jgi:hypothetical protein